MRRDPIELEIFKNLYHSIAEEMGAALRRTAFSPNIKERRDYSCAVFDSDGHVIAMGDHMPVHLGSMPMSVQAAIDAGPMLPGDVVMLNDPFRGGTHLPDITLVAPVYVKSRRRSARRHTNPDFYVASRAHHADVGGAYPGSMGLCREIYQEGVRIPPVKLMREGVTDRDVLEMLLNNVRTPEEREGDLGAQIAACHTGAERLREIVRSSDLHCGDAVLHLLPPREKEDGDRARRGLPPQERAQLPAAHAGHVDVEDDEVRSRSQEIGQSGLGVGRRLDMVAVGGEKVAHRGADRGLIIDDDDALFH